MSRKLRDLEEQEAEEGEGWLTSYSDMITDLLAVFVLLFSFAMLSQGLPKAATQSQASIDMSGAQSVMVGGPALESESGREGDSRFGGTGLDGAGANGAGANGAGSNDAGVNGAGANSENSDFDAQANAEMNRLIEELGEQIEEAGLSSKINIEKQSEFIFVLRMADSVLFNSGRAEITAEADVILRDIFKIIEEYQEGIDVVRVEGHTDNRPISSARYPSNWELSSARALSVLKVLLDITSVQPEQAAYTGYGEYRPLVENSSPENMAKNRRVDFFIEMERNTVNS